VGRRQVIEIRHLRYFIAVAELLNFHKAAERLHITQPPLSQQMRDLECELGVALFVRDRRHVELTDSGRLLLPKARELIAQADQIVEVASRASHVPGGRVRIGVAIGLTNSIRRIVSSYAKQFPKVEILCQDLYSQLLNKLLRNREIDVGLVRAPVDAWQLVSEPLFQERLFAVLPKTHPLAMRKSLCVKELADETLLFPDWAPPFYKKVLLMYRDAGVAPNILHITSLPHEAGAMLVTSGKGIYILPGTAHHPPAPGSGIKAVPLDKAPCIAVHIAWRNEETSVAVLNFLEIARKVFPARNCLLNPTCDEDLATRKRGSQQRALRNGKEPLLAQIRIKEAKQLNVARGEMIGAEN
jgi:DNA-binding transcriptional LysR family regulator